jgi:OPA family glycerol-3-phosphate transporter-like MFS transporter
VAIIAFALMRDTPQSCGLPPIEEYKNDYPDDYSKKHEEELTAKQIFMKYVLPNKLLWYIAAPRVRLSAALRHSRLVADLPERGEALRAG